MAFDFVVVGGGTAGSVLASRLSEHEGFTVALLEAGSSQHALTPIPLACTAIQGSPQDWAFQASAGKGAQGFKGDRKGRMPCPRGKMLGGSSALNYAAYVRGHPGDYDQWQKSGATGWAYSDLLPLFKRIESIQDSSSGYVFDSRFRGTSGPLPISIRQPTYPPLTRFCQAAEGLGFQKLDYNGGDRGGASGCVSVLQSTTKNGFRVDSYSAYLKDQVATRSNLTIITEALAIRVLLDKTAATGVEYCVGSEHRTVVANKEVILCCGAIQTPQLLQLSGIGPKDLLSSNKVTCVVDSPQVGQGLQDHLFVAMLYDAPGLGVPMANIGLSLGPDALRANPSQIYDKGPLPADPREDESLPLELKELKTEAEKLLNEYLSTGTGYPASSMYDGSAFFSTGLGSAHSQDGQIAVFNCGFTRDMWEDLLSVDTAAYFHDPQSTLNPTSENVILTAGFLKPESSGSVCISSLDPGASPKIDYNYFSEGSDIKRFIAIMRKTNEIALRMGLGRLHVPCEIAKKHSYADGQELSDALLEDWVLNFASTYYHPTSTCRMGSVVDHRLKVIGTSRLRIADASVMPEITSGNTQAPCYVIGEKAALLIVDDYGTSHCSCAVL